MLARRWMLLLVALTASCASHRPDPPIPVIHRIVVIPATNPRWYSFENAAPPLGIPIEIWANKLDSHSKARRFNKALDPAVATLGDIFNQIVEQKLRDQGFTVEVLHDLVRRSDDPDNVDEEKIAASVDADAIVHLWVDEIGMYSGRLSTKYVPRVNLSGKLWIKGRDNLYWDTIEYGVDAKNGKSTDILSDERYRWGSFDEVMSHVDDVRAAYLIGTQLAATRLADQMTASTTAGQK